MAERKAKATSIFKTNSPGETGLAARALAAALGGGETVFLYGPIGSGKTTFVKALAAALGAPEPASASFSLMREYRSRKIRLFHADFFRLSDGEIAEMGLETAFEDPASVFVAEWPEPLKEFAPKDRLELEFSLLSGDGRRIAVRALGPKSRKLAEVFK